MPRRETRRGFRVKEAITATATTKTQIHIMKYTAQITLTQNGEPGALKGEDLDLEMEDLIQGCEPDGWEIASINLSRAEISKSRMADRREMVMRIFDALVRECDDLSQPARINPEYTKAEICELWREDLKKLLA